MTFFETFSATMLTLTIAWFFKAHVEPRLSHVQSKVHKVIKVVKTELLGKKTRIDIEGSSKIRDLKAWKRKAAFWSRYGIKYVGD